MLYVLKLEFDFFVLVAYGANFFNTVKTLTVICWRGVRRPQTVSSNYTHWKVQKTGTTPPSRQTHSENTLRQFVADTRHPSQQRPHQVRPQCDIHDHHATRKRQS